MFLTPKCIFHIQEIYCAFYCLHFQSWYKTGEEKIRTTFSIRALISKTSLTSKCNYLLKKRGIKILWARILQFLLPKNEDERSKVQRSWSFLSMRPLSKGAIDMKELDRWICNLIYDLSLYGTFCIFQNECFC